MTSNTYSLLTELEDPGVHYVGPETEPENLDNDSLEYIAPSGDSDTDLLTPEPWDWRTRIVNGYASFLTRFPYVIIAIILCMMIPLAAVSWTYYTPPDYANEDLDLTKGFETRGTPLRKASTTSSALFEAIRDGDTYSISPHPELALTALGLNNSVVLGLLGWGNKRSFQRRRRAADEDPSSWNEQQQQQPWDRFSTTDNSSESEAGCMNMTLSDMRNNLMFVFESSKGKDMFTVEALLGLCQAEQRFILPYVNSACPMMSVHMYVALLSDKESCLDLTEADVTSVRMLLEECAIFYRNGTLTPSTTEKHAAMIGIPEECAKGGYIAKMLHNFADVKFFAKSTPKSSRLRYSLAYLRADSDGFDEQAFYMDHLNEKGLDNGVVKITAVGLTDQSTTKFNLFGKYLIIDLKYFVLAAVLILVLMILYLKSFSLVIATLTNVLFSFIFAYFVYSAVYGLEFFPFINVLALLILIAVGADDVFVFYDSWQQAKISEDGGLPLEMVTSKTFSHAALSIFVTSLTTAAAFFTNYVSHITAVCCFGVFAGTAILSNFLFMVTWTPAVIILVDRIETWVLSRLPVTWGSTATSMCNLYLRLRNLFGRVHNFLFETMFPFLIGKLWFLWIVLLLGVGIGGCVVVFVTPRLRLPVTKDIQLFPASNLLENWDLNMQDKFQGVMSQMNEEAQNLPAMFVWGFQPRDDGSKLNPDDDPTDLVRYKHFNLYAPESQTWLLQFCHDLQNQTWVPSRYRRNMMCSLDAYSEVLIRTCPMDLPLLDPFKDVCCHNVTIPLGEEQLKLCGPAADLILYSVNDPTSILRSYAELQPLRKILVFGMLVYDTNNIIAGYFLRVFTKFKYSYSLEIMDKQYHAMLEFFNKHMHKAPRGMTGAFFSDEYTLSFYDLQNAIAQGTYYSISLSLIVALLVMLVTSRNLLLTLYAIVTIALAIAGNVASIVLLGWRLNIIESVTISLAVGLSIDFTIHYGMAYRMSSAKDAKSRVNESFSRVGGAVAMAALTTFSAGAAVIPCHVLPYTKLGMFLMLCMSFSWVYATFFFQSVCRIIGPKANFCQMPSVCDQIKKFKKTNTDDGDSHSLNSLESNDSFLITF